MSDLINKYIKNKKYTATCYEILNRISRNHDSFYASYLKLDGIKYLKGKYSSHEFYAILSKSDKLIYLQNQKESERRGIRLNAGEEISDEDAIYLLNNASSPTEVLRICKANETLTMVDILELTYSNKIYAVGALHYYLYRNNLHDDAWFKVAISDVVVGQEPRRIEYLRNNLTVLSLLANSINEIGYSAKTHVLSYLSRSVLTDLLENCDLKDFNNRAIGVEEVLEFQRVRYLALLAYYVEKSGTTLDSGIKDKIIEIRKDFIHHCQSRGMFITTTSATSLLDYGFFGKMNQNSFLEYYLTVCTPKASLTEVNSLDVAEQNKYSLEKNVSSGQGIFNQKTGIIKLFLRNKNDKFANVNYNEKQILTDDFKDNQAGLIEMWHNLDYRVRSKFAHDKGQPADSLSLSLDEAENEIDLEKIILIYAHYPKLGEQILIQSESTNKPPMYNFELPKYESGMVFLTRMTKDLDMEKTVTAIALIRDWSGTTKEFEEMVKYI